MKVFVLVPDYGYEGYGKPEGVYKTLKLAERAQEKAHEIYSARREIIELDLEGRRYKPEGR